MIIRIILKSERRNPRPTHLLIIANFFRLVKFIFSDFCIFYLTSLKPLLGMSFKQGRFFARNIKAMRASYVLRMLRNPYWVWVSEHTTKCVVAIYAL